MAKTATLSSGSVLLPDASMSQSGLMLAALVGGFVIWLMMQGKLGNYWSILMGGSSSAAPTSSTTTPSTAAPSTTTPSTTTPSTAASPSTGTGYLVPPMPSIGFPGLKGGLF